MWWLCWGRAGGSEVLKITCLRTLAAVAAIGIHMGINQISGNFHKVNAGDLYRSAQPGDAVIDDAAKRYGIKTIINLCNEKAGAWYTEETARQRKTA